MKKNKLILILTLMLILPFLFLGEINAVTIKDIEGTKCYYYKDGSVKSEDCWNINSDYPYFQRKKLEDNTDFFCESGTLAPPKAGLNYERKASSNYTYAIGYIVKNVYKNSVPSYYWTEFLINKYLWEQTNADIYENYNKTIPSNYQDVYNKAKEHQELYNMYNGATVTISSEEFQKNSDGDYYTVFSVEITERLYKSNKLSFSCLAGSANCNDNLTVEQYETSKGAGTTINKYKVTVDTSDIPYREEVSVSANYNDTADFYQALEYAWDKKCVGDGDCEDNYQDIVTGYETIKKEIKAEYVKKFVKEDEPTTSFTLMKQGKYASAAPINAKSDLIGAQYILMPELAYNYYSSSKSFDDACNSGIIDVTSEYNFQNTDLFDPYGEEQGVCYRITTGSSTMKIRLPRGKTYYLVEEKAPNGYLLNTTPVVFNLNGITGRLESNSENIELGKRYIILFDDEIETKISKLNLVNGKELPGATLQILDKNKNSISCIIKLSDGSLKKLSDCTWVSGEEPVYVYGLPVGKYFLKEIQAPEGFALSEEMVSFEVKDDGTVNEVVMENALEVEVPDTLSFGSTLLLFIGMFDVALGIGMLLYVKKNKATE